MVAVKSYKVETRGFMMYIYIYHTYIYICLTAVGLTPGGSSTLHIYTQTIHIIRRKENNTEKEHRKLLVVPRVCELDPGICLTTEEKALKYLS
jgi:hypothetical protein